MCSSESCCGLSVAGLRASANSPVSSDTREWLTGYCTLPSHYSLYNTVRKTQIMRCHWSAGDPGCYHGNTGQQVSGLLPWKYRSAGVSNFLLWNYGSDNSSKSNDKMYCLSMPSTERHKFLDLGCTVCVCVCVPADSKLLYLVFKLSVHSSCRNVSHCVGICCLWSLSGYILSNIWAAF